MITKEIREKTYSNITPAQDYLYSNGGAQLLNIAQTNNFTDFDWYKEFALVVGDIILGFYDVADTEPLLIQELSISAEVAKPLATDVQAFLAPLSDPNWQPPAEEEPVESVFDTETVEEDTSATTPITESTNPNASAPEPIARPTVPPITPPQPTAEPAANIATVVAPATTPGIRTMAHDMEGARSPQRNTFEPLDDDTPTHISNQS